MKHRTSGLSQEVSAVMFRQQAVSGQQGFSDFTHPNTPITVAGQPFDHLLYQFRLAFSGWRNVLVIPKGGITDGNQLRYDRAYYIGEQDFYLPRDKNDKYKRYKSPVAQPD